MKKTTKPNKVTVSEDGLALIIEVPMDQAMPLSSTGKSHLLYTSRLPIPVGLYVEGREIHVSCTVFIERIPGKGR